MIQNSFDNRPQAKQAPGSRSNQTTGRASPRKKLLWMGAAGVVLLALGTGLWQRRFHSYTPLDALRDLQVAAQVSRERPAQPVRRFLELRYGALTEPANRQRAFQDIFNVGHIEGLYLVWHKETNPQRLKTDVASAAETLAEYRSIMSPEERAGLAAYFRSEAGRAQVRQASACYLGKDVRFRSDAAPLVKEVLTTLTDTRNP